MTSWTLVVLFYLGSSAAVSAVVPGIVTREACEELRADMSRIPGIFDHHRPAFSRCVETVR